MSVQKKDSSFSPQLGRLKIMQSLMRKLEQKWKHCSSLGGGYTLTARHLYRRSFIIYSQWNKVKSFCALHVRDPPVLAYDKQFGLTGKRLVPATRKSHHDTLATKLNFVISLLVVYCSAYSMLRCYLMRVGKERGFHLDTHR